MISTATTCLACNGTGGLLNEACPLCGGIPQWPESEDAGSNATEVAEEVSADAAEMEDVSGPEEIQERRMNGGILMLSEGFFHFTVFMPVVSRRSFTEAEVAGIGTTWTHGISEAPSFAAAMQSVDTEYCGDDLQEVSNDLCGVCLQPFCQGDKLMALPCATRGCSSVWHLPCIHEWLNQGHTPSCPLCRAQIELDVGSESSDATTFTFVGNDSGRAASGLSRELMGALFQALLSH